MKKTILSAILFLMLIDAFAQAPAQQKASIPIPPPAKQTFSLSAATANKLPAGAIFRDNKVFAEAGYSFKQNANGGFDLINNTNTARQSISGGFKCSCSGGGSCGIALGTDGLRCTGPNCCTMTITNRSS